MAPHDPAFRQIVAEVFVGIEAFFLTCIRGGRVDGTVTRSLPAETLSQNLLGVLMGIRVLARVRPERALLEGVAAPAAALLRVGTGAVGTGAK